MESGRGGKQDALSTEVNTQRGRNGHSHLTVLVILGLKMIRSVVCNKNREIEKEAMGKYEKRDEYTVEFHWEL